MSNNNKRSFYAPQSGHVVEDGVIKGVSVVTLGEAKGHGVHVDDEFVDDIIEQGNSRQSGVKCRLGHPAMFADAIGSYVGRLKNFRRDGAQARADMHLSKAAKNSPKGDLYSYLVELAKEDSDQFGLSIVFDDAGTYMKEGDINTYVRLEKLCAVDVVDEPAANPSGLFASDNATPPRFVEGIEIPVKIDTPKDQNKEHEKMQHIKEMAEKFGAEKAVEYFSAGLSLEQASEKFAADSAASDLENAKKSIVEKDAMIAGLSESVKSLESKIAELAKGAAPVAMSAAPVEQQTITFCDVVAGLMKNGSTQFDAVRKAAASHKDLHAEWLKSKKPKFNSVV